MDITNLSALREVAEKVSSDDWESVVEISSEFRWSERDYIKLVTPATILALLDHIASLSRIVEEYHHRASTEKG